MPSTIKRAPDIKARAGDAHTKRKQHASDVYLSAWPRLRVQMLFGPGMRRLASMPSAELARLLPHSSLVQLILMCSEAEEEALAAQGQQQQGVMAALGPGVRKWIDAHGRDSDLQVGSLGVAVVVLC